MSPSASRKRILEMFRPGKSPRSWLSTSPMLSRARDEADCLIVLPTCPGVAGEVHQTVLADLDLVATLKGDLVDAVTVHVGAVQAAHVRDRVAVAGTPELGVAPGHGDVVEEDLAVGVTAGGDRLGVQQEAAAGARTPLHDQQGAARGQGVDRGGVGVVERALLAVLAPLLGGSAERDRRRRLTGTLAGAPAGAVALPLPGRGVGRLQASSALRAEACPVGVL